LLGGLATVFGLNQGAFAAEINSSAMTEKQGAKELSRFFANFFKIFGFDIGEDEEEDDDDDDDRGSPGEWGPLLDLIKSVEAKAHKYEAVNYGKGSGVIKGITNMTITEAYKASEKYRAQYGGSGAVGQYQFMTPTKQAKDAGLNPDTDKFSPANQDKMAIDLIENKRGGKDWKAGKLDDNTFMKNVAAEWRGLPAGPDGKTYQDQYASRNAAHATWDKYKEAIQKIKGGGGTGMARGGVKPFSFLNSVDGIFEMSGPDTGYRVPEYLTGGAPVIGHGLEWLIKMSNKFIILPGVNKEYDVYKDPAKAFNRYEQIGNQGGVEVAGLIDAMDRLIFGGPSGKPVSYPSSSQKRRYYAADESGAEILRILGGTPIKGASLPEGSVTPVAIPKDTVTGTTGGAMVAMVQPVIQYIPVPVPGPERVEYVPANSFVVAQTGNLMRYLQSLS